MPNGANSEESERASRFERGNMPLATEAATGTRGSQMGQQKSKRQFLKNARIAERSAKEAHKKEISPDPPSIAVGLAKKGELMMGGMASAIAMIPYVGFLLAIPFRMADWMVTALRMALDFSVRKGLRHKEESQLKQASAFKKEAGVKEPPKQWHGGGLSGWLRSLFEGPFELFGIIKITGKVAFHMKLLFFAGSLILILLTVANTLAMFCSGGVGLVVKVSAFLGNEAAKNVQALCKNAGV